MGTLDDVPAEVPAKVSDDCEHNFKYLYGTHTTEFNPKHDCTEIHKKWDKFFCSKCLHYASKLIYHNKDLDNPSLF